jgi:hypothetical protein
VSDPIPQKPFFPQGPMSREAAEPPCPPAQDEHLHPRSSKEPAENPIAVGEPPTPEDLLAHVDKAAEEEGNALGALSKATAARVKCERDLKRGWIQNDAPTKLTDKGVTDTAAAIIAAQPFAVVGDDWETTIANNSPLPVGLQPGKGVTLGAGDNFLPPKWVGLFVVQYTGPGTVKLTKMGMKPITDK